jgi:glutamine cyclotransferase
MTWRGLLRLVPVLFLAWCGQAETPSAAAPSRAAVERLRVEVIGDYPHDPRAFTQGLQLHEGVLYESTGLVGRSSLRQVDLPTGNVQRQAEVPKPLFAEGIAVVGDRIVQLTWQNHVALVYDLASFEVMARHAYPTEGWGLCYDGRDLIMSDGTHRLYRRNPQTFDARGVLEVTEEGQPVTQLNELECVGESIYANVWTTNDIVRIRADTGEVSARIDASGLLTEAQRRAADVLNGIAYDPSSQTFLLTGKLWPKLFRVRFVPARS